MNDNLAGLVTWTTSRTQTDLNGAWKSIIDVYDVGVGGPFGDGDRDNPLFSFAADRGRDSPGRRVEYDFDTSPTIEVPGDWNTQHERFHFYEGSMWFRRRFPTPAAARTGRTILYVGAANYATIVFLNGERVAEHEGGYGPFCVELTGRFRPDDENSLVLRVDNRRTRAGVPTTRTDWFNYGGITRDVVLLHLPDTHLRDAVVQLEASAGEAAGIAVDVWLDGDEAEQDVEVLVAGASIGTLRTGEDGRGSATFPAPPGLQRWSPTHPVLHDVVVRAATDEVHDRIGFRTISTSGSSILLNGEPVFLAGISLHDEALGSTARRIASIDEARAVLAHAQDLGCNFVRLAHYQHNEHTVRACDELGLLAWCEIPVYWAIDWTNEETYTVAESQLRELIERDRNRAAVVLWSVANETPVGEARTAFLGRLVATARTLDDTRLITAALFARPQDGDFMSAIRGDTGADWVIDDPLGADLDVLGVNEYHGWYYGSFENMATLSWSTPYDKPLVVSEFGGDARYGLRGAVDESWTEDHQAEIYRHQFAMLERIGFLAGTSPWILKDFRAPFRLLPGVQDGFNRKGLIDLDGHRKLAFGVVADWYARRTERSAVE